MPFDKTYLKIAAIAITVTIVIFIVVSLLSPDPENFILSMVTYLCIKNEVQQYFKAAENG